MRAFNTRAMAAPKKTLKTDSLWAAKSIVESWVLSPNSAKKTRIKVVKKVFHESKAKTPSP